MSRRFLLFALAALVALGTARVVAGDLADLHRRAARLGRATPVVVAVRDLRLGATVAAGDVEVRRVHEPFARSLRRTQRAVGRRVAVPVLAGAPVLAGNLSGDGVIRPGTRAVRLTVEPAWPLPAGSVVDVLVPGGGAASAAAEGAVVLTGAEGDDASTVTVLVTVEGARRLASAAAAGPLTLALAPPEDACCATSSSVSSKG